MANQKGL